MQPFAYDRAGTIDDALAAAAQPGTALLAGGTELLNWMRLRVAEPERVIDVTRIPGLDAIDSLAGGGLRIGATARLNDVAADPRVRGDWPVLREAIHKAASAQLRNLATIGGNLLQKTRCAYFRSEDPDVPCNRRTAGSGCAAIGGQGDRHALFGWTEECIATHPADPPVALAALDAELVTRRPGGAGRRIAIGELYVLPDERVDADTVLEQGEVIEALELRAPAPGSAYVKVRERESYEYAVVSAAATVQLNGDGTISSARIALGSVAMRPWRLRAAEQQLAGLGPDGPEMTEVLRAAIADARPAAGSGYKVAIAVGAARRALMNAARAVA
jgi:xanthine dehydrogenase YagS FAD-binding subunit